MFNNKIRKHVGIWLATFACAAAVSCYTSQDVQADHYSYGNNPTHQSTDAEIAQGLVRARHINTCILFRVSKCTYFT